MQQAPPPSPQPPAIYGQPAPSPYAGFWIRLVVRVIDGLILGLPLAILYVVLIGLAGGMLAATANSNNQNANAAAAGGFIAAISLYVLIAMVVSIGYYVYFWGTSGQTIAMKAFRIRIVDATTGAPIGMGRAALRWLGTIVNSMACYLGWIWVAFDPRKQGWHDKIANSVVLQN